VNDDDAVVSERLGTRARADPPILPANDDDAVVLERLSTHSSPSEFVGTLFKGIWLLKRLARAAKLRVRQRKAGGIDQQPNRHRASKSSAGIVLLRERLRHLNLAMRTIEGDGNCQFRAFSLNLFGSEEHHPLVRARAVDYMQTHASEFREFIDNGESRQSNRGFSDYLSRMSKGRTWGDELTLRALCNAFGAIVHVMTSQEGSRFYLTYIPDVKKVAKQVFLAYISPAHYNTFERLSAPSRPARKRVRPADATADVIAGRNSKRALRGSKSA
jgi:hypothetical protein